MRDQGEPASQSRERSYVHMSDVDERGKCWRYESVYNSVQLWDRLKSISDRELQKGYVVGRIMLVRDASPVTLALLYYATFHRYPIYNFLFGLSSNNSTNGTPSYSDILEKMKTRA